MGLGLYVHSLGELPADAERAYYVYLLDYGWEDARAAEMFRNFEHMADLASRHDAVVIRGVVGVHFEDEVLSWHHINGRDSKNLLPAILITTRHPRHFQLRLDSDEEGRSEDRILIVPLRRVCATPQDVAPLLEKIFTDIRDNRALRDFEISEVMRAGSEGAIRDALIFRHAAGCETQLDTLTRFLDKPDVLYQRPGRDVASPADRLVTLTADPTPLSAEVHVTDAKILTRRGGSAHAEPHAAGRMARDASTLPAIDLLIVVATDIEQSAVVETWQRITKRNETPRILHGDKRSYEDLGVIAGTRVALVQTLMGTATVGGSLSTTQTAIHELKPRHVIMVGIAFGVDPEKQPIGTVLVAKQVHQYQVQRIGTRADGIQIVSKRGDKATASPDVLSRLQVANRKRPATFGLLLSGDSLVDNHDYREELRSFEPEACGGEMEGGGVYVAATEARIGWSIVKAVCDWADGNKAEDKDNRQRTAARQAAEYVLRAVDTGGFAGRGPGPAAEP